MVVILGIHDNFRGYTVPIPSKPRFWSQKATSEDSFGWLRKKLEKNVCPKKNEGGSWWGSWVVNCSYGPSISELLYNLLYKHLDFQWDDIVVDAAFLLNAVNS